MARAELELRSAGYLNMYQPKIRPIARISMRDGQLPGFTRQHSSPDRAGRSLLGVRLLTKTLERASDLRAGRIALRLLQPGKSTRARAFPHLDRRRP